jgi:hypothetical protein
MSRPNTCRSGSIASGRLPSRPPCGASRVDHAHRTPRGSGPSSGRGAGEPSDLGDRRRCTRCVISQGLGPTPLDTASMAPLLRPATKRYAWPNKVEAVANGTLVIEPASARAQRPPRRGPTGRPAVRQRLTASPHEPPASRRGDRVVQRFAHAPRLRGTLASRVPPPCSHAPAPCGHALGRPTGHSGSP